MLLRAIACAALVAALNASAPAARHEEDPHPRIVLVTAFGTIELELDAVHAPITTRNFLRYVDIDRYNGGRFHRTVRKDNQPRDVVRIGVIQGGVAPRYATRDFDPIPLEPTSKTGLRHVDGAISMARAEPDTATSDFFICIGDQPELDAGGRRNPDGRGFAAFGRVVAGMDVVRRIQAAPASGQSLEPPVKIISAHRVRDAHE